MPAPAKTTDAEIIAAARRLLERRGANGFSMGDLADAVGVRAPSLYGRFASRATVLDAVELDLWRELGRRLQAASSARDPIARLTAQAHAYRRFAKANPQGYALLFRADAEASEAGTRARLAAVECTLPALAALVGPSQALQAARVLTPFLHGFVSMELAGAFRLGPGVQPAFEAGVATLLRGLSAPRRRQRRTRSKA